MTIKKSGVLLNLDDNHGDPASGRGVTAKKIMAGKETRHCHITQQTNHYGFDDTVCAIGTHLSPTPACPVGLSAAGQ